MTNSKNKGDKNERELAKVFQDWTGKEFARVPQSGGLHWHAKNSSGDVICTDDRHARYFTLSIEAKHHREIPFEGLIDGSKGSKKTKIKEFWAQCSHDAVEHRLIPALFMRYDRMPKRMFFTVVSIEFYYAFKELMDNQYGVLTYISAPDDHFVILNSRDFFSMDYKKFHKLAKKYLKSLYV